MTLKRQVMVTSDHHVEPNGLTHLADLSLYLNVCSITYLR
jgi:hypothetical protein